MPIGLIDKITYDAEMEGTLINQLEEGLAKMGHAQMSYSGFDIEAKIERDKLLLVTTVFHGGNYIPPSVRRALGGRASLRAQDSFSEVLLTLDQEQFRVLLSYRAKDQMELSSLLDDFLGVAEEWRMLLDEYGQQDLIHVPVS